jgi:hypothetical protein
MAIDMELNEMKVVHVEKSSAASGVIVRVRPNRFGQHDIPEL